MGELVDVVREGPVARVVMHRGGNNAIAADLMSELRAAFDELGGDPGCRVVVLQSAYERYFSVGADLGAMGGMDRSAAGAEDRIAAMMRESNAGFSAIEACPRPVIARINGHALGGGCELTLCCDYRIMVEDGRSRIGQTESALGIIPGAGGTQRRHAGHRADQGRGQPGPGPPPRAGPGHRGAELRALGAERGRGDGHRRLLPEGRAGVQGTLERRSSSDGPSPSRGRDHQTRIRE
jgi:hypothetical protein